LVKQYLGKSEPIKKATQSNPKMIITLIGNYFKCSKRLFNLKRESLQQVYTHQPAGGRVFLPFDPDD
jgi:hypothetical protein